MASTPAATASNQDAKPEEKLNHSDGVHAFDPYPYLNLLQRDFHEVEPLWLPPGFTKKRMDAAVAHLMEIVGVDGVEYQNADHANAYNDPFAIIEEDKAFMSSCAILPTSVEQVVAVVKLANKLLLPLWIVSRGRNLGYGGAAPRLRGSAVLDLKRMCKIIEVNERFAYALVEPGVTFHDIYDHCVKNDLKVWPSAPGLGWGSVTGNALDRGWGYTPMGEAAKSMCGLEVVMPDGDLIRTGNGAIDGSTTWQLFHGGFGPDLGGLFQQSNMGVVTKLGMQLYPAPSGIMSCYVDVPDVTDLTALVDTLCDLRRADVINNNPVIGSLMRGASMRGPRATFYKGTNDVLNAAELFELKKEVDKGAFHATFALYGDKVIMDHRWKQIEAAFAGLKGARLRPGKQFFAKDGRKHLRATEPEIQHGPMSTLHVGMPSIGALDCIRFRAEKGGHFSFSPILPPDGKAVFEFYQMAEKVCNQFGFDFDSGMHCYARHVCSVTMTVFDREDADMKERAARCFEKLVVETRKLGYSEYRCHVQYMDLVSDQYDFNGHALRRTVDKIKAALDPNGIIGLGKQGIWGNQQHLKSWEGSKVTKADEGHALEKL
ncbi:hypothetical protein RQP46_011174 [Phenoliferia psychrophenolica]